MRNKAVFCISIFLLMQVSISLAVADTTRNLVYYPEDYEGKTLVFKRAKIGGPIVKNSYAGVYCLHVEINGKYIPGVLYKSQLNFVVVSPELADRLTSKISRNFKYHKSGHEQHLMDHLYSVGACSVRLTAKIQNYLDIGWPLSQKLNFTTRMGP